MKTIDFAAAYRDKMFLQGRLLFILTSNTTMTKVKLVYISKVKEEEQEEKEEEQEEKEQMWKQNAGNSVIVKTIHQKK